MFSYKKNFFLYFIEPVVDRDYSCVSAPADFEREQLFVIYEQMPPNVVTFPKIYPRIIW